MKITWNGKTIDAADGATLETLLEQSGLAGRRTATAVNGTLVPAAQRPRHALREGDVVDIFAFAGGG